MLHEKRARAIGSERVFAFWATEGQREPARLVRRPSGLAPEHLTRVTDGEAVPISLLFYPARGNRLLHARLHQLVELPSRLHEVFSDAPHLSDLCVMASALFARHRR
jgi:hypothetical protein